MNFTDSPYELMMKQKPYVPHKDRYTDTPDMKRPIVGKRHGDKTMRRASGQLGPKLGT